MKTLDVTTDCPLLDPEEHKGLIESYNLVVKSIDGLEGELRQWVRNSFADNQDRPDNGPRDLDEAFRSICESLTRSRYRIGHVGRSQLGKSSAANLLFGVKLLKEGGDDVNSGGSACTSVVTVIHSLSGPESPDFQALYFSEDELQTRFANVAADLPQCPVQRLPASMNDWASELAKLQDWKTARARQGDKQDDAAAFLDGLARQYLEARPGQVFGKPTASIKCRDAVELEQRLGQIVAFRPDDPAASLSGDIRYPLLIKEVIVRIHVPGFSPQVEVVDLPGLGTMQSYDTELTKEYVRSLDGLVLFVHPDSVDPSDLKTLCLALKERHHQMRGRVWLVVVKMDTVNPKLLKGGLFKSLEGTINKLDISSEHARFLSCYCRVNGELHLTKTVTDRATLATALGLKHNNGEILPPECLEQEWSQYQGAFDRYLVDGGCGEFRDVVEKKVAQTVRTAVCADAAQDLDRLIDDLTLTLKAAADGGLDDANRTLAFQWSQIFLRLPQKLAPHRFDLTKTAGPLFDSMWGVLNDHLELNDVEEAQKAKSSPPDDHPWVVLHREVTGQIVRECRSSSSPEAGAIWAFRSSYWKAVQDLIEREARGVSGLQNGDGILYPKNFHPIQELRRRIEERWKTLRPEVEKELTQLQDTSAIQDPGTGAMYRYSPQDYLTVMRRKIEGVCYSLIERVRSAAVHEVKDVHRRLSRMTNETAGPVTVDLEAIRKSEGHLAQARALLSPATKREDQ